VIEIVPVNPLVSMLLLLSATAGAQVLATASPQTENPIPSSNAPVVLTNIQQIAALSDEALRRGGYEATVQGTIIYVPQQAMRLYLQDGTNAMYADFNGPVADYKAGQRVELTGRIKGGWFVPCILPTSIRLLAEPEFPEPVPADVARLNGGENAMRFVSVHGVVRDMMMDGPYLLLLVVEHGITYRVHSGMPRGSGLPRDWMEAEIQARGMCRPISDNWGNAFGFVLYQNDTNQTTLLKPGTTNFFERSLLTVSQAASLTNFSTRRLKASGTVLAHTPGGVLFLQDSTGVMRVELLTLLPRVQGEGERLPHDPQTLLAPGERVEVLGARQQGFFLTPTLVDGEFRRIGHGPLPQPRNVSAAELEAGSWAGQLVTVRARLLDQRGWSVLNVHHRSLVLQDGERVFHAHWESDRPAEWNLQPNQYVAITGVNAVEIGEMKAVRSFQLLLRSPSDIVLATAPAFWTTPAFRRIAPIASAILVVAAAWIFVHRRQRRRLRDSEVVTQTINYFATSLLERYTEEDILWDLAKNCISQLGFEDCVIYLVDKDRNVLVQRAALGPKNPVGRVIANPLVIPVGKGIVGSVAVTGVPELIEDTSLDGRYIVDDERRFSEITVPICANGKVIGIIDSEHVRKNFFTQNHLKMLTAIASLCANKLVRVWAEQRLRQSHDELEHRVSERAGELVTTNQQLMRVENELRVALAAEKELNQLKSSFVSMVSHEFRTPLEVILSSSNILDRYLERLSVDKRKVQLRAIRKSVHRMNDLIEDVLMLGKLDAGRLACHVAPVDLEAVCRRAIVEIESATGREGIVRLDAGQKDPEAQADEGLLHHILTNLLGNAVKYSPPDRQVEFTVSRHGGEAEFVIRDRGCGIPAADQTRLFTAFYRGSNVAQTPGSGLGLVIAKRCVDLHGGNIRCESQEGQGTTFTVTLPLFEGTRFFRRQAEAANGVPTLAAHPPKPSVSI
jgi:signal transduction histidine kinase